MSQGTFPLGATLSGTEYTNNLNDLLEGIDSNNSGATAPAGNLQAGKLWLDTSTSTSPVLKIYDVNANSGAGGFIVLGENGDVFRTRRVYKNASAAPATPTNSNTVLDGTLATITTNTASWSLTQTTPGSANNTYTSVGTFKQEQGTGSFSIQGTWAAVAQLSGDTGTTGVRGPVIGFYIPMVTRNTTPDPDTFTSPLANFDPRTLVSSDQIITTDDIQNYLDASFSQHLFGNLTSAAVDGDYGVFYNNSDELQNIIASYNASNSRWVTAVKQIAGNLIVSGSITADAIEVDAVKGKTVSGGKTSSSDTATSGFFLDRDGTFIVGGGGQNLIWDGDDLTIPAVTITGTLGTVQIADGAINAAKIATGTITAELIEADAITADKISSLTLSVEKNITVGNIRAGGNTILTATTVIDATSITVADTTGFPDTGSVLIGGTETFIYTSKTATTFVSTLPEKVVAVHLFDSTVAEIIDDYEVTFGTGVILDGSGKFAVGSTANSMVFDGTTLSISGVELDADDLKNLSALDGKVSASLQTYADETAYAVGDVVIGSSKNIWRAKVAVADTNTTDPTEGSVWEEISPGAAGGDVNVQSNWTQTTTTADDFIKNKPTTITSGQASAISTNSTHSSSTHAPTNAEQNVQSNWNATSGDSFIENKPTTITSGQASAISTNSTHSSSTHAPTNAEQNVQSNWNATSGDSFIENKPTTITSGQATDITNALKTTDTSLATGVKSTLRSNIGAGTSSLAIGTTSSTALAGDTSLLAIGTTSTTALAGDTSLLAIGTTSTTALAGNTTTITSDQATAIGNNSTHRTSSHAPTDAEKNVQSNWNATSGDSFIENKPTTITSGQASAITTNSTHTSSTHAPTNAEQNVQSDWNATSGDAFIDNKPTTITSGQASAISTNSNKTTNANHTGDVTGATALSIGTGKVTNAHLGATAVSLDKMVISEFPTVVWKTTYDDSDTSAPAGNGKWQAFTTALSTNAANGSAWSALTGVKLRVKDNQGLDISNLIAALKTGSYIRLVQGTNFAVYKIGTTHTVSGSVGSISFDSHFQSTESTTYSNSASTEIEFQVNTDAVVDGNLIVTGTINTDSIKADSGVFTTLAADSGDFGTLVADTATITTLSTTFLDAEVVVAEHIGTNTLDAVKIKSGTVDTLQLKAGAVKADKITVDGDITILKPASGEDHDIQAWSDDGERSWNTTVGAISNSGLDDSNTFEYSGSNAEGFYLGQTSEGPRFFMGSGSGIDSNWIKWNGDALIATPGGIKQQSSVSWYATFEPNDGLNSQWLFKTNTPTPDADDRSILDATGETKTLSNSVKQLILNTTTNFITDDIDETLNTDLFAKVVNGTSIRYTRTDKPGETANILVNDIKRVDSAGAIGTTTGTHIYYWLDVTVTNTGDTPTANTVNGVNGSSSRLEFVSVVQDGVDLGDIANITTDNTSVKVGYGTDETKGQHGVTSLGYRATANGTYSTAIGNTTEALGQGSIAIGLAAIASARSSIRIGDSFFESGANGTRSIAIGATTTASSRNTIAIGYKSTATEANDIAIGYNSTADGEDAIAIGANTDAEFSNSIAIGAFADARAANVITIGNGTVDGTKQTVELGQQTGSHDLAVATKLYVDTAAAAAGSDYLAVNSSGTAASATGADAIAIGEDAVADGENSIAIGKGATLVADPEVILFPTGLDNSGGFFDSSNRWRMTTSTSTTQTAETDTGLASNLSSNIKQFFVSNTASKNINTPSQESNAEALAKLLLMRNIVAGDTMTLHIPASVSTSLTSDAYVPMTLDQDPSYEKVDSLTDPGNSFAGGMWRFQVTIAEEDINASHTGLDGSISISTAFENTVGFQFGSGNIDNRISLGNGDITSLNCNVQTISSLSDERDKTDIIDLSETDGLPFINKLKPRTYYWDRREWYEGQAPDGTKKMSYDKDLPNSGKRMGFIAQETEVAMEGLECISESNLVTGTIDKKQMALAELITPMVKAIQQLSDENEDLKARLDALENP